MLKNYFTVALRTLRRQSGYTVINVVGLAVGLACCLLIALYVRHELSYDRYHVNADRIYRAGYVMDARVEVHQTARTPHPLAPVLVSEFPETKAAVRFRRAEAVIRHDEESFRETAFYYADAAVFDVFSFSLIEGDPATALTAPFSLVLTEEAAHRYFGETSPIGRSLLVPDVGTFTITGVLQNLPSQSHFTFDLLASYATLEVMRPEALRQWDSAVTSTYVLLAEGIKAAALEAKFSLLVDRYLGPNAGNSRFFLDPLTRLHLHSDLAGELGEGGDARSLYVFAGIALFILLIACINFMSLTTARSARRTREVGMRKVVGASRIQLIVQFLAESVLLAMVALGVALILVDLTLPAFNALTGKALAVEWFSGWFVPVTLAGIVLVVGLLAGSYPAFVLSAFRPTDVLQGQTAPGSAGARLRSVLVVVQFSIAIALVAGTLVMAEQLAFLHDKDLGFDKEQVVVISMQDEAVRGRYQVLKDELLAHPNVLAAAASYHTPGRGLGQYYVDVEGREDALILPTYIVDEDYLETMGMEVVTGRGFSKTLPTDATEAFMINETAARRFGWDEPLGKTIIWDDAKQGTVIGVVKDFHVQSLYQPIEPLIIHFDPDYFRRLSVRIRPTDIPNTLAFLKAVYEQADPNHPFEYGFLDEDFAIHYQAEQRAARLVRYAALLAIFIACLGLFGLAALTTEQRTKEIGIRKVLGASVPGLVALLSKDFARLVLMSFVVAVPFMYFGLRAWLDDFAYHISLGMDVFLLAGMLAFGIALGTVSYQAIRTALTDPIESLRYE